MRQLPVTTWRTQDGAAAWLVKSMREFIHGDTIRHARYPPDYALPVIRIPCTLKIETDRNSRVNTKLLVHAATSIYPKPYWSPFLPSEQFTKDGLYGSIRDS